MCNSYQRGDSETTKIIKIEHLVIAIEVEQVSASEDANIDKFTRFQTFAQIAIKLLMSSLQLVKCTGNTAERVMVLKRAEKQICEVKTGSKSRKKR